MGRNPINNIVNNMNIEHFIHILEEEFEDENIPKLQPETQFKDLDQWSSMYALIIIALIETEYDVLLNGEELLTVNSIDELFQLIVSKKK
jgi:acyl carrier protein